MNLTTLPRVKRRIDELESIVKYDALLSDMISEVSALVETYLSRGAEQIARTLLLDVHYGQRVFVLGAWPVLSSPAPVLTSNGESDFSVPDDVVTATDYRIDYDAGILYMTDHTPSQGPKTLQLVVTAGMATSADYFARDYPDIAGAVDAEVVRRFHHRRRPDAINISDAGGSFGLVEGDALMKKTMDVLDVHRREGMLW